MDREQVLAVIGQLSNVLTAKEYDVHFEKSGALEIVVISEQFDGLPLIRRIKRVEGILDDLGSTIPDSFSVTYILLTPVEKKMTDEADQANKASSTDSSNSGQAASSVEL